MKHDSLILVVGLGGNEMFPKSMVFTWKLSEESHFFWYLYKNSPQFSLIDSMSFLLQSILATSFLQGQHVQFYKPILLRSCQKL